MKKFSELANINTQPIAQNISESESQQPQELETINDTPLLNEDAAPFPEYMINDSSFVGYESDKHQYTIYRAAEFATIVTGVETILDVGCGRGDFGDYILNRFPNVKYTGIDLNDIMIQLGQYKYSEKFSKFRYNLQASIFPTTFSTNEKYDYVYHINSLSVDYGLWQNIFNEENRYEFLKQLLLTSLEICNIGVVFMLHNESTQSDGQLSFSLTPISKILYDMNLKFAIDNTDVPDMYKLVVLNNSF